MSGPIPPLRLTRDHEFNFTSQCGEDGIVAAIFQALQIERGLAVEFGAWDGVYCSNTALLRDKGWRVCLIEGNEERFDSLRRAMSGNPKVTCLNAWVGIDEDNSLDWLLTNEGITEVDFLSIDIDGDDYHIFRDMALRPKVVCIEFNPTIPPPISMIGKVGEGQGSSLVALEALASSKAYTLVYATLWNAFFVRQDLASSFVAVAARDVYRPESARVLICEYNGRNRLVDFLGNDHQPWNPWAREPAALILNLRIIPRMRQALPAWVFSVRRRLMRRS